MTVKFFEPNPIGATNTLLVIGNVTAVIPAGSSLDEYSSQTSTFCVQKFSYQSAYCCLIRYILWDMHC